MPAFAPGFGEAGGERIGSGDFAHAFVSDVDDLLILQAGNRGRIFEASQMASGVEQAQFVGDFADAEADLLGV